MRSRANWGALALIALVLQSACVTGRMLESPRRSEPNPTSEARAAAEYDVDILEPGSTKTRPAPLDKVEFLRALQRLARGARPPGTPREAAQALLNETVEREGEWRAEVSPNGVLTLVPLEETALTPEAGEHLRRDYLRWCENRGGGDCLGLLDDGPFLRAEDRRTLALALALGSVLDETQEALAHELGPRALVSMVVWAVGLYCMMWVVPEPATKAVAAALTVLLVGWLGVDCVWGLMNGWVNLAIRAHEATTFDELRELGAQYAAVLGTNAARALVLAVGALTGRTLGSVAARVRSLPGYGGAVMQWQAEGLNGSEVVEAVQEAVAPQGRALALAVEATETVATSPEGPLAIVLLKKRAGGGGGGFTRGGASITRILRHRGGNQQVEFSDGTRWHLPRGKSPKDIPLQDKVGDQLQQAVTEAAREWGPHKLSFNEKHAIQEALKQGKYWLAQLLEREARGRYVQSTVKRLFEHLYDFDLSSGVDVIDPATGSQYEILSGTESNMARHGRRMAGLFFRMLVF